MRTDIWCPRCSASFQVDVAFSCDTAGLADAAKLVGVDQGQETAAAPLPTIHEYTGVSVTSVYLDTKYPPLKASVALTHCSCGLVHSAIVVDEGGRASLSILELGRELERLGAIYVPRTS